jgi:hypothetical protein
MNDFEIEFQFQFQLEIVRNRANQSQQIENVADEKWAVLVCKIHQKPPSTSSAHDLASKKSAATSGPAVRSRNAPSPSRVGTNPPICPEYSLSGL